MDVVTETGETVHLHAGELPGWTDLFYYSGTTTNGVLVYLMPLGSGIVITCHSLQWLAAARLLLHWKSYDTESQDMINAWTLL